MIAQPPAAWVIALLGATLHLDTMVVGQWMVSRPLVVGSCLGWLVGQAWVGFLIGVCVELVWARAIPVGLDIPPELCGVTVLATGWIGLVPELIPPHGTLFSPPAPPVLGLAAGPVVALALATPWSRVGRWCDLGLRRVNLYLAEWVDRRLSTGQPGSERVLAGALAVAIGLRWGVMALGYWGALLAGEQVLRGVVAQWGAGLVRSPGGGEGLALAGWLLPCAGLAVLMEWFLSREGGGGGGK